MKGIHGWIPMKGLEQTVRNMRKLEPRIQKNILRGATRAVASEVKKNAKALAPVDSGNLKKNIISKSRRGKRYVVRASVVVNSEGKRGDPKNAFYWRFLEYGHFVRSPGGRVGVKNPRPAGTTWIPGKLFITRAFQGLEANIDNVMASYIRKRIDKEIRKR